MSVSSHLDQLRMKHDSLKQKIKEEQRSPGSNDLDIKAMKLDKLHIKEEIARLTRDTEPAAH